MIELAPTPPLAGTRLVVLLVSARSAPARGWDAGAGVTLCAPESRQLRRVLASLAPSWCVADETVEDAQVRGLLLEIRRAGSRARILLLGPPDDPARCERWIRRGVQVYLSCGSTPERIVQAMRHAELEDTVAVDACFQRPILELVDRLQPDEDLSPRELEVLRLASRGLRTEEIAARLHLTAHTVNFHLGNATAKLGVRGRTQAVVRALLLGLIAAVDA